MLEEYIELKEHIMLMLTYCINEEEKERLNKTIERIDKTISTNLVL